MSESSGNNRRSLPRRAVKRQSDEFSEESSGKRPAKKSKQQQIEDEEEDEDGAVHLEDEEEEQVTAERLVSYRWIDGGKVLPNGNTTYQLLEIVCAGKTHILAVGDTILLRSFEGAGSFGYPADDQDAFVAVVEKMWEEPAKKNAPIREHRMKLCARWYFKRLDVEQLRGSVAGPLTKSQLLARMTNRDLILSDQYDDNDVLTVLGKTTVVNRRPVANDKDPELPPGVWVSKYSISFGEAPGTALLSAWEGENQPWPSLRVDSPEKPEQGEPVDEMAPVQNLQSELDKAGTTGTGTSESAGGETTFEPIKDLGAVDAEPQDAIAATASGDEVFTEADEDTYATDDKDMDSFPGDSDDGDAHLNDGSFKSKIMIGADHQVKVGPFQPGTQVASRNPTLVWEKEGGASVDMNRYLLEASTILLGFLEQNGLMTTDPYFPLPHEQMEKLLRDNQLQAMTLSNMSTGSTMAGTLKLTREVKLDSLIELLHAKNHDIDQALAVVKEAPQKYVTCWTKKDRDLFNTGFRKHSGSLRAIRKNTLAHKSFKEVIDYHYRFKIPDQFRRYQDNKREHAVKMIQIIENRRSDDANIVPRDENRRKDSSAASHSVDWTKTGVSEVVGAVEDRRTSAKDLLLEIQQALGFEKVEIICKNIKTLRDPGSLPELKNRVEAMLDGYPALLERFLDYIPKKITQKA